MGYVIRHGLFPHMTCGDNVGTVPRLWDWDRATHQGARGRALELVGLDQRNIATAIRQLSGGQRQPRRFRPRPWSRSADPLLDEPSAPWTASRASAFSRSSSHPAFVRETVVFRDPRHREAVMVGDRIS
jgi:osmoprotectant transport system ATP-binding protein